MELKDMDEKIIWIGIRESEILYSSLFYKSITIYGSNSGNNISKKSENNLSITDFFIETINKFLGTQNIKLFFYSPNLAERVLIKAPYMEKYIINKYDREFHKTIENKTYSQLWASNVMPVVEFTEMFGIECNYSNIAANFRDYDKFVIQENISSGGKGTFLLTPYNEAAVSKCLDKHKCYKISPYYEHSFSLNIHMLITNDHISLLQPSIQIIENVNNNLLYKGADFISYNSISADIKNKITASAKKIGESLRSIGYVGICGIDMLVQEEKVFFLEINPRFQASTILINRALQDCNLPDIQTIVYNIYNNSCSIELLKKVEAINVPYSMLSFYQNDNKNINNHILALLEDNTPHIDNTIVENKNSVETNEYMFRVIFNTNISSINPDGEIFVYQNLLNYSKYEDLIFKDKTFLKIALLTQGVIIHNNVKKTFLDNNQSLKNATFDAIDIRINDNFVINCPTKTKFVELSPFSIQKLKNGIGLFFCDSFICPIKIDVQEKTGIKQTKSGINIHRIGFLTTDRLRIKHTTQCYFKKNETGCKFCHITSNLSQDIPLEDIYEVIDCYLSSVKFRHFLIGGPSNTYTQEFYYIKNIVQYIRTFSNKPIYVMSIPPKDTSVIGVYHQLGVTEVAYNIEIFNRELAKQYMPGKGAIPLHQYLEALKISAEIFGCENTRSMLIIGLDSRESFLNGIEQLCKLNVTPMISPFRPMENTELSDFVPPSIDYIFKIYNEAKNICSRYKINLGPKCDYCKNNTLT